MGDGDDLKLNVSDQITVSESVTVWRRVDRAILIDGLRSSLARLDAAMNTVDANVSVTFLPLFEALNWSVALLDYLRKHERRETPQGRGLRGLNFVRGRVHHQWTDAIDVRQEEVKAFAGPLMLSGYSVEWFWVPHTQLPPADKGFSDSVGEREYVTVLAGRDVRDVFRALNEHLDQLPPET